MRDIRMYRKCSFIPTLVTEDPQQATLALAIAKSVHYRGADQGARPGGAWFHCIVRQHNFTPESAIQWTSPRRLE